MEFSHLRGVQWQLGKHCKVMHHMGPLKLLPLFQFSTGCSFRAARRHLCGALCRCLAQNLTSSQTNPSRFNPVRLSFQFKRRVVFSVFISCRQVNTPPPRLFPSEKSWASLCCGLLQNRAGTLFIIYTPASLCQYVSWEGFCSCRCVFLPCSNYFLAFLI